MKAEPGLPIVGLADESFNNQSANVTSESVTNKRGKKNSVQIGYIRATVNIGSANKVNGSQNLNDLQK
jgi:hypothetical protein